MLHEAQHPNSPAGAASPIPIAAAEGGPSSPAGHKAEEGGPSSPKMPGRTGAESSPACRLGPASSPAPGTSPGRAGLVPPLASTSAESPTVVKGQMKGHFPPKRSKPLMSTRPYSRGRRQGSCLPHRCSVSRPAAYCHYWHGALAVLLQMDELAVFRVVRRQMANSAGEMIAPPPFGTKHERWREPPWAVYDALHVVLRGLPRGRCAWRR